MTAAIYITRARDGLRLELRPMFSLAWPVVAAELGWMAMALVDTMMVGRVSAAALGAVSVGGNLFFSVAISGMGMLLGLDFLVARAIGAGALRDAHSALFHGVVLSGVFAALLTPVLLLLAGNVELLGIDPGVRADAAAYMRAITASLWPLLLYSTLRSYLQSVGLAKTVMLTFVSANLINAFAVWVLVFGRFGAPPLGAEGAGWGTAISRVYMLAVLLGVTLRHVRRSGGTHWRVGMAIERARIVEIIRLGIPAAAQRLLEVGVFATATVLAARLDPSSLAAHQVALSAASTTFMVPLGISVAAAVRVGQAVGRRDPEGATRAGWTALLLGAWFMLGAGVVFVAVPGSIVRIFTGEASVIETGVALLSVAAMFQLFDGLQVVATGALRGIGDTRTPMLFNLIGHWVLGLPVGYALCFWWGWGVVGLWVGLSIGLIAVALALFVIWASKTARLVID